MIEKMKPTHTGRLKSLDKIIRLPAKYHPNRISGLYLKELLDLIDKDIEVQYDDLKGSFYTEEIVMDEAYFEWIKKIESIETDCWYLVEDDEGDINIMHLNDKKRCCAYLNQYKFPTKDFSYCKIISKMEAVK